MSNESPRSPLEELHARRAARQQAELRAAATERAVEVVVQRAISLGLATDKNASEVIYMMPAAQFRNLKGEFNELSRVDFKPRDPKPLAQASGTFKDANTQVNEQLFAAVQRGDPIGAKNALEAGADPNYCLIIDDEHTRTEIPVVYVASSWSTRIELIYRNDIRLKDREGDLANNATLVKMLLERGGGPNVRFMFSSPVAQEWDTCLIASFPSLEIAAMLLEYGADPTASRGWREDCNNETFPLQLAGGDKELLRLLSKYGAR